MGNKPILCMDFDGVIHSYSSGWKGANVIPDPPVPGALQFLAAAMEVFTVAIYSSRSHQEGGTHAMREWLSFWSDDPEYGMPSDFDHSAWGDLQWPDHKPAALITIDDRALTFDGTFPDPKALLAFKPWNKREFGAKGEYSQYGKLNDDDQGALKIGVARNGQIVRVDFGKPVAWLGLPPSLAVEFAKLIMRHAGVKSVTVEM